MKTLSIILFGALLVACSTTRELSNSEDSIIAQPGDEPSVEPLTSVPTEWQITSNSLNGRTAQVGAAGMSPNGPVGTFLQIQCPTAQNNVTSIQFNVQATNTILDFDFDSFEGPDAPNQVRKLIEIVALSDKGQIRSKTSAAGWYGAPNIFVFGVGSERYARLLASGGVRLKFIVHDASDAQKTIEATFPPIEPQSDVARTLNRCRP